MHLVILETAAVRLRQDSAFAREADVDEAVPPAETADAQILKPSKKMGAYENKEPL